RYVSPLCVGRRVVIHRREIEWIAVGGCVKPADKVVAGALGIGRSCDGLAWQHIGWCNRGANGAGVKGDGHVLDEYRPGPGAGLETSGAFGVVHGNTVNVGPPALECGSIPGECHRLEGSLVETM